MTKMPLRLVCLVAGIALSASAACAHDIWLTTLLDGSGRRIVVNFGEPFDRLAPDVGKLLDLQVVTHEETKSLLAGLKPITLNKAPVLASMAVAGLQSALITARYDNGYWVKTQDGTYRNTSKRVYPGAQDSVWSMKFAKTILGGEAPWDQTAGHELEIVPLANPVGVGPGGQLRVRVLFRGEPLAGGEIVSGDGVMPAAEKDTPRFATDSDGVAVIPIVKEGSYVLSITHRVRPSETPQLADLDFYNATLAFWTSATR